MCEEFKGFVHSQSSFVTLMTRQNQLKLLYMTDYGKESYSCD